MAAAGLLLISILFVALLGALYVPFAVALVASYQALFTKKGSRLFLAAVLSTVSCAMALLVSHLLYQGERSQKGVRPKQL